MTSTDGSNILVDHARTYLEVPKKARELEIIDPDVFLQRTSNSESGWERTRILLDSLSLMNPETHEARLLRDTFIYGSAGGLFYGAFIRTSDAQQRFIRKHNAAVFEGKFLGVRKYKDTLITECVGFGLKYMVRNGLLCFIGGCSIVLPLTYRNEARCLDLAASCGIFGAITRIWLGGRATLVGSVLGSIVGIGSYAFIKTAESMSGKSYAQYRALEHQVWRERNELTIKACRKFREKQLYKHINE